MEDNNDEQIQQALAEEQIVHNQQHTVDLNIEICKKIIARIPANELRATHRPSVMAPRTFLLERPFSLLPTPLNQPCIETTTQVSTKKLRGSIENVNCLSMQQFFKKDRFKTVYNKLQTYRPDHTYFSGKLKGLDSMADYNWKSFKQLEQSHCFHQQIQQDSIDSDFESGNMCKAYISREADQEGEYYLVIQNDLNTYGYNIWFFFRFKCKEAGPRRFTIVNIIKQTSFYSQGMLLSIFSLQKHRTEGTRWFKGGNNITFSKTNFIRNHHEQEYYYSLSFQYDFQHTHDEVFFALNQPYTYSRLISLISNPKPALNHIKLSFKTVCYSISNNIVPLLHIFKEGTQSQSIILVLARQHPCETAGSFIAEYVIRELISDSKICGYLLDEFEFVVIPMANPDGVIHGMSRTNMAGLDLNRQWSHYSLKELTPQTIKMQQYITALSQSRQIRYMIDLHGHGKKLNSFFFCCKSNQAYKENYRLFSFAMKKMEERFSIFSCTYGITKDKENTLRSRMHSMGIRHSYTLETSQYGWRSQNNTITHFNEQDFKSIAQNLLNSIFLIECDPELTQQQLQLTKSVLLSQLLLIQDSLERAEKNNELADQLSDSDPQGDRLDMKDFISKCDNKLIRKKIQENFRTNSKKYGNKKTNPMESFLKKDTFRQWHARQSLSNSLYKASQNNANQSEDPNFAEKKDLKNSSRRGLIIIKQKTSKKTMLPLKVNKPMTSQYIEQFNLRTTKRHTRMNTEPTEKTLISSSLSAVSEYSNHNKLPSSQPYKRQQHLIQHSNDPNKHEVIDNLQLKFKQLKKESLNYVLTDTLSVMKIAQQPRDKRKTEPPYHKNNSLKTSNHNETVDNQPNMQRNCKTIDQRNHKQTQQQSSRQVTKPKTLKQFLVKEGNNFLSRLSKQGSSVYYHFPIL